MDEFEIVPYEPSMNMSCLELERLCPQGSNFRLSFSRDYFHRRAENFDVWKLFVGMKKGEIVGVVAVALKDLELRGRPMKGALYFDLRVHPLHRHQGMAQKLGWTAKGWALAKGAKYHYLTCVDDNRAMLALGSLVKGTRVGSYRLLVWPVHKRRDGGKESFHEAAREEVHGKCIENNGPYDLYADPFVGGRLQGHVASFMTEGAGCSLWSTAGILEERVERVPLHLSLLGRALRTWPFSLGRWPHVPGKGEIIKGLYVYDLFARDLKVVKGLLSQLNDWSLERGMHHLYIIDPGAPGMLEGMRKWLPKAFSPILKFSYLSHTPDHLDRIYVDIRDL